MNSLFHLAESDPDIMLLTGDLGYGVFEKFEEQFPRQFLNIGVAEQNMIGVATGLAMEGKKIFSYSIGNFPTLRCLEQIRNDACYHELNINIVAAGGGFSYGGLGMSHHATEDLSIMRALPGVTVIAPCTDLEAGKAIKQLVTIDGVGYLRIDKSKYMEANELAESSEFKIGKARALRTGCDYTLIVAGGIAEEAMEAANILSRQGIECRVISMHTIKPIDRDAILTSCKETKGVLTIEENTLEGGLGSSVSDVCMEEYIYPRKFKKIGMNDTYSASVGSQKFLRKLYKMDKNYIIETILSWENRD